ncbi:MAG: VacJ family lipoprotein [Gammaproteobacteria bacterium]
MKRKICCFAFLCMALILGGCAQIPAYDDAYDPLEKVNRYSYKFNDTIDRAVLKPVAKGYKKTIPSVVRTSVRNFFSNLGEPLTIVNQLLQWKPADAMSDLMRFTFNSTFGLAGLFDIATGWDLPKHQEDFGQTMGVWGVGQGAYLMLPLLGPSNVRDFAGLPFDWLLNPTLYRSTPVRYSANAMKTVSVRADLLETTRVLDETSIDRYISIREAYRQLRWNRLHDGNPPEPDFFDELFDEP